MPTTVSLALGSGGARGYAHIGVIEELLAQGFEIRALAGSSMGALVGGIYARGRLDAYRDWSRALTRYQVWRLVDLTLSGGGFIKGERVMAALRELVGEADIETLPIRYTAVAADLDASREIWFTQGPLFEAIRASIAIPSVFRPVTYRGHILVDGGLLNPVPVSPLFGERNDLTIAVDVNAPGLRCGPAPAQDVELIDSESSVTPVQADSAETSSGLLAQYRSRIGAFVDGLFERKNKQVRVPEPGALDLFARSLDTVQATLTRFKLAAQPPDLVIAIPRSACAFYDFDCADRLIELGRERASAALADWRQRCP